ncbi:DUF3426 domain-containing protein [Acinetobacter sp. IK40]|jgi:predicted Zn finger-like uncharacterized protein|uniref:DUF3426 domain-containing protein n=1 Tax=Acinetobacter sp. IK40 TaxID=2928897 RepID=UPI002D1EE9B8|nr:DUF3426 domain-containing protein [Acinetobacter sp. IK40]MEB3790244.1 zinc-ribbon and DUF3426 domain-containing protein [Acinetobacter sp. IK40]
MSEKQTRCPKCSTVYKVTLSQLSVAQGMVCCPKCVINFNALTNLLETDSEATPAPINRSLFSSIQPDSSFAEKQMQILRIFDQKIENSNIDLLTYLNNLNYFNTEPVTALPNLNLSEDALLIEQENNDKQHGWLYYTLWGIGNIALILVFAFQILWFNPKLMHESPALNQMFNYVCGVFNCKISNEQYQSLSFEKVKLKRVEQDATGFSGVLLNQDANSVVLPPIKVILKQNGEAISSTVLKPQDYLVDSLKTIQRIPSNSPFRFEFIIPKSKNSFNDYSLEFVQP